MNAPLNILIIEDHAPDFQLLTRHLQRHGLNFQPQRVMSMAELEDALASGGWDIVLSDYNIPRLEFQDILNLLQAKRPNLPLILVTGSVGEERAVELLKQGVWDFVLKDSLNRLVPAIERSLNDASMRQARLKAEEALRTSEEKYRGLFENSRDAIMTAELPSWRFTSANPATLEMFGLKTEAEACALTPWELSPPCQSDGQSSAERAREIIGILEREGSASFRWTHRRPAGGEFMADVVMTRMMRDGKQVIQATVRDITRQVGLEAQLRQAQKMEAVGRLAGGVAHDFNNLLTAILGYSAISLNNLPAGSPVRANIEQVHEAGESAARLTRQLLAFSRKQILQPQVLDLNALITNVVRMLRRLIGEDVQLSSRLSESLPPVKADPGQLEQVLTNLAVNARDAMPHGGLLSIETSFVTLITGISERQIEIPAGPYAVLVVTDTGCGMTDEVKTHLFEPFFTTKEMGKGTGLGLSTVYGIVKQTGGFLQIASEVGRGTTVRIYLPPAEQDSVSSGETPQPGASLPRGTETVLLVEDDEAVRTLARTVLSGCGYRVLTASLGTEAIALAQEHRNGIALLLSDVIMPGINGPMLAQHIRATNPSSKILFMSGYTDMVTTLELERNGAAFLQKPFTPITLAVKVREVLNAAA